MPEPSAYDEFFFPIAREFIESELAKSLAMLQKSSLVLNVGDQGKRFNRPFPQGTLVKTLDIIPDHGAEIVADICDCNESIIQSEHFDGVLLIEVLEHVVQPFAAVEETLRILKPGGLLFFSSPLNCRIHGPVPDCWRFTEFGLKVLFKDYDLLQFEKLESPDRNLFPLQYFGVWQKPLKPKDVKYSDLRFERIK